MGLEKIRPGENAPDDINVVIEIPSYSSPIKYEVDKNSGMIKVDRFLNTSMSYPCEYGFIPNTLSEDGDPVDVLVISPFSLMIGSLINCRPIGILRMTDESGIDAKVLAVPNHQLGASYDHIQNPQDLSATLLNRIKHFFEHYKDLDKGKWSKVENWEDRNKAYQEINSGIKRFLTQK